MPEKQTRIIMTDEERKVIMELVDHFLEKIDDDSAYSKFVDSLCSEINNILNYTYGIDDTIKQWLASNLR